MSDALRNRIGAAIAEQHAAGALVSAEVDDVIAVLEELGLEGWVDKPMKPDSMGYLDVVIRPTLDPEHYERVLVLPMSEETS